MKKELYKGITKLILFSGIIILSILKIDTILVIISKFLSVMFPVFFGLSLAFILKSISQKIYNIFKKLTDNSSILDEKKDDALVKLSILITYILFFGLIISLIAIVIPEVRNSISKLYGNLGSYFVNIDKITNELHKNISFLNIDTNNITEYIKGFPVRIGNYISVAIPNIFGATIGVMGSLLSIVLGVILSLYIIFDAKNLKNFFSDILNTYFEDKKKYKIIKILKTANDVFSSFIIGQLTEAFILGILCFIGMSIFKFEYAPLISIIIGTLSLIPLLGAFLGALVSFILLLGISPIKALWFLVFFIALQQFEGNVIYPKVVGDSLGLPAIWLLCAIIIGGGMFGILGTLLGIPMVATFYRLLVEDIENRKEIDFTASK